MYGLVTKNNNKNSVYNVKENVLFYKFSPSTSVSLVFTIGSCFKCWLKVHIRPYKWSPYANLWSTCTT